ncbi:MAG TPA: histidinol-phosphate transaminase [Anaerovoracaceae bacterium]|nr:histidinol-phosphate transaminase [Anaerovoracaceae bacterium]
MKHGGDYIGYFNKYGIMPIDYSENTSPFGIPEGVKSAICDSLEEASRYPDTLCRNLKTALARYHKVEEDYIICGNGAADIIFKLSLALKPKKAVVTAPTFSEYEEALSLSGCKVRHHILKAEKNFEITEDILNDIKDDLDVIFICQPNNPTGKICDRDLLNRILNKCNEKEILLVIDECFLDFIRDGESSISKLKDYENLFILKAYTKLYAMAGVRLGYGLTSNKKLLEEISKSGQPWSVSIMAQAAGIAALREYDYVEKVVKNTEDESKYLKAELKRLGIKYYDSKANYILMYSNDYEFDSKMEEKGFLIRNCSNYIGLDVGYYRISVKKHEDNARLIKAMGEILNVR